jgi:phosphate transport system substrate-binding protein
VRRRGTVKTNKWFVLALVVALALGTLGLAGCTSDSESDEESTDSEESADEELTGSINVEGSDTIVNMGQAWAEAFMEEEPGVMVSVKGGGSGTGIAALLNGTVDFANASRAIKDEEIEEAEGLGVDPVEHEVAIDGIAVIINPANTVTEMTMEQLGQVYRGEVTNWSEVGGADADIVLLGRDTSSGTYEYFKEAVVWGADGDEALEYSPSMNNLASNQAIVDEVKNNEAAIGYVGLGYLDPDVTVASIDGVQASVDTAADGSYPISRFLYMYSDGDPEGVLAAYLDWILGDEGQAIAEDQGFVPLP